MPIYQFLLLLPTFYRQAEQLIVNSFLCIHIETTVIPVSNSGSFCIVLVFLILFW